MRIYFYTFAHFLRSDNAQSSRSIPFITARKAGDLNVQ